MMVTEEFTQVTSTEETLEAAAPKSVDVSAISSGSGFELSFSGKVNGRVVVRCSPEGGQNIAGSMLMMDAEELSHDDVSDAMGECANMICGALKVRLGGADDDFQLSIPTPLTTAPDLPRESGGALLYQLSRGLVSIEVWRD